jgi:uncharacterized protein
MEQKYKKMKQRVETELSCSAHDMEHVLRVYNLCLYLAQGEPVDLDVLRSAALLHDIARVREDEDQSREIDHALLGAEMAEEILKELCFPEEKRERIKHCIAAHRFRSSCTPQTREAEILFDADKLDVLGAVGVGRSFMVAGKHNERMYVDTPLDAYLRENTVDGTRHGRIKDFRKHAPNIEFETKSKHIPDVLYTTKAKEIARKRIGFMENFFEQLKEEIQGEVLDEKDMNTQTTHEYIDETLTRPASQCEFMHFKREIVDSLERALKICNVTLAKIREKLEEYETKYNMTTEEFNERFEKGQLGDDEDFFEWNAYKEYCNDWQKRRRALEEILWKSSDEEDSDAL